MLLNCAECPGRGSACSECVVSVLLDPTPQLPSEVARAIGVLQDSGLIGPAHLALVSPPAAQPTGPVLMPVPSVTRAAG